MPTVEWINARGVRMMKHYTYSKQGISDANKYLSRLKNQGLTATVTHKYAGKTLGGESHKQVTNPSAEMTFAPERTYKTPIPKRKKKKKKDELVNIGRSRKGRRTRTPGRGKKKISSMDYYV